MSQTDTASLLTLPFEMLHRIFDDFDAATVFVSMRDVCQQLRTAVNIYYRYELDYTSLSKPDFHRLLRRVDPECVTGLRLSDGEMTTGQIGLFLSLVDIGRFTRLRSLTLLHVTEEDLCTFLEHATGCSLTSLTLHTSVNGSLETERIVHHLLTIIAQPSLRRLEFLTSSLCDLIDQFHWPVQCKLQHLAMQSYAIERVVKILLGASDLETLVIGTGMESLTKKECNRTERLFLTPDPPLTSLTLSDCSLSMDEVDSLLSFTPSLRHLKIIDAGVCFVDGSRWEELIKTKLTFLEKFEFCISFNLGYDVDRMESDLSYLISPFCTPFWTEEKLWPVTACWFPHLERGEIYTSPICASSYTYSPVETIKTFSNFRTDLPPPIKWKGVNKLCLNLYLPESCEEQKNEETIDHWLSNITNLTIQFGYWSPLDSCSSVVDLSKVTKLSLDFDWTSLRNETMLNSIIDLFKQTSNIQSLTLDLQLWIDDDLFNYEHLCSAIIDYVDPSKLRHLKIPVRRTDQTRKLLETFTQLTSVTFSFSDQMLSEQILLLFSKLWRGCRINKEHSSLSIWLGERRLKNAVYRSKTTIQHAFNKVRLD